MRRPLLSLLCLGCVLSLNCATAAAGRARRPHSASQATPASSAETDALRATYSKLLDASRTKDAAALGQILADGYWQTLSDGTVRSKEQRIGETVTPDLVITSAELVTFRAVVHGDAGVATAEVTQKGTFKGRPFESRVRSTAAFIRVGGQWRILTTHLSDLTTSTTTTGPN